MIQNLKFFALTLGGCFKKNVVEAEVQHFHNYVYKNNFFCVHPITIKKNICTTDSIICTAEKIANFKYKRNHLATLAVVTITNFNI